MTRKRALLYVQHLLGIGHLKRALTLARALTAAGLEVTVVSGGFEIPELAVDGIRVVQLPPAAAADLTFKVLIGPNGAPIDDAWKQRRRDALLDVYREVDPDTLVIELYPFGRRQMRFELEPLLDAAVGAWHRPLIACSVRDIGGGGQRELSRQKETVALIERYFDLVLVHSDPRLIPFERSFALAEEIADKLHYTGFIVERPCAERALSDAGKNEVIVSAGGGAVGRSLLETAVHARALTTLTDRTWRLITGVNAAATDAAMIAALAGGTAGDRVIVERIRSDFTTLLKNCTVSVSQGGYNTMMEIVEAGARAVIVPFAGGAETEQTLRASLFADLGLIEVVHEAALTPESLAAAIERAASKPQAKTNAIDLNGAHKSAALLMQWREERSP